MLIVDGHLDLAWNALQWNRDLTQSVYTIRTQEGQMQGPGRALNTVALPEMRNGQIGLCFATLLARSTLRPVEHIDYRSAAQANAIAQGQLAYYRALEQNGEARIVTDATALHGHVTRWQAKAPQIQPGLIISMESADPILEPQDVQKWYAAGVRIIGPAHYGMGRYAGGTGVEDGLTEIGVELLHEIARLGIVLDLTHLSDKAFWQALELFNGVVLASHQNCRALVPHQRQFSDEQLQAIIERGGVIGAAFDNWMLSPGWKTGTSNPEAVSIEDVVDHIDHVCQLAGTSRHAAIGSDLDGGFGREQSPHDLDTIADLQEIAHILEGRGYVQRDIEAIMHGNWVALLNRAWNP